MCLLEVATQKPGLWSCLPLTSHADLGKLQTCEMKLDLIIESILWSRDVRAFQCSLCETSFPFQMVRLSDSEDDCVQ